MTPSRSASTPRLEDNINDDCIITLLVKYKSGDQEPKGPSALNCSEIEVYPRGDNRSSYYPIWLRVTVTSMGYEHVGTSTPPPGLSILVEHVKSRERNKGRTCEYIETGQNK